MTSHQIQGLISRGLRPGLRRLRSLALEKHSSGGAYTVPTQPIIDADSWSIHTGDEPWILWRGRRTYERLVHMPIKVDPDELLVGLPELREPTSDESGQIANREALLDSIPPFPGGDAGHFQPDYQKLLTAGIGGIAGEIDSRKAEAADSEAKTFYSACRLAMDGFASYCLRVADQCESVARSCSKDAAKSLKQKADICRKISTDPPDTFAEAIQLIFLALISLWFGEDHHLTCPGRLDRLLLPYYKQDIEAGKLSTKDALDLISALYIQLNFILYPGSALSVMIGGKSDGSQNVTNDLTFLCLIARQVTALVYPTIGLSWHEETPDELTEFACEMIAGGIGDPAFFNDDLISAGLRDHGVSEVDSRNYMNSTCVEIKPVGTSHIWVTAPYFNCARALLDVIHEQKASGLSFEELQEKVRDRIAGEVEAAAEHLHEVWQERSITGGFPLASCLINDCLERGVDFDSGGARYNWVENSFVGLANLVDGLSAVKHLVYEKSTVSLAELYSILEKDFNGHDELLEEIQRIPAYGNGNQAADDLAAKWATFLTGTTERHTVGLHRYVPGFFCWIMHERFGRETGATPDGRKAGFPLADGAGAAQGREKNGPTASIRSTTSWNHKKALGGLVHNLKLSADIAGSEKGLKAMRALIESYLRRGGFEIQVNVVNSADLKDAQLRPQNYADLLVRVAGYSDYFVHLPPGMQEEVIRRTEHSVG